MARETTKQAEKQEPYRPQHDQPQSAAGAAAAPTPDSERALDTTREQRQARDQARTEPTGMSRRPEARMYAPTMAGDPFTLMNRMAADMDRLFEQFGFGRTGFEFAPKFGSLLGTADRPGAPTRGTGMDELERSMWTPQVEVRQRGDKYVVRADLPGVKKDDVHVNIDEGTLTIRGERREEREEKEEGFYRTERSYGQFFRAIPLPEGVNEDKCEATFSDGVLQIAFPAPKQQERKARRIPIR